MNKQILDLLFLSYCLLLIGAFLKDGFPSVKKNKKNIVFFFLFTTICILFLYITIMVNGTCGSAAKNEQLLPNLKTAYCKPVCYCDGYRINDMCMGSWRKVCQP